MEIILIRVEINSQSSDFYFSSEQVYFSWQQHLQQSREAEVSCTFVVRYFIAQ